MARAVWAAPPAEGGEKTATKGVELGGKHCLEQADALWLSQATLVVQTAPAGAELEAKVAACLPLIRGAGELFDYTHLSLGLDAQVTAGYAQVGPYIELLPISVLGVRAELHGVEYFPSGVDAAGYFPLLTADASFQRGDLPNAASRSATGFNAVFAPWLQLELDLADGLTLFVWDEAALEHWSLGAGPYFYNARWDLILAAQDELVRNDAYVGMSLHPTPELALGVGPISSLRRVPASDYTAHQLGGALSSSWRSADANPRSIDALLAAGAFVEHAFRRGAFVTLALSAGWDVGPL